MISSARTRPLPADTFTTLDPTVYSRTWTSSSLLLRVAGIQRRAVPIVAAAAPGGKATPS